MKRWYIYFGSDKVVAVRGTLNIHEALFMAIEKTHFKMTDINHCEWR